MYAKAFHLGLVLVAAVFALSALAHEPSSSVNPEATGEVPLHDDLGDLSYRIETRSPKAQRYFDQGLSLTYAFHHAEALRSFRAAQLHDPDCAMCYWGEALALGPHINAAMAPKAANPAVTAVRRALALARDKRERALAEALVERYSSDPERNQSELDKAYARAMQKVLERYPSDPQIGTLYADAVMNTTPWNYWKSDGVTPNGASVARALKTLERVLDKVPNHVGAIHLYIHLTEASKHPERAETFADKLAALMPGAGHIVHMPSHVYYRLGRYADSAKVNKLAVRADARSIERMDTYDIYRNGYYPHNIHFVIASAQMAGDGVTALEYTRRLEGKIELNAAENIGWVQRILAVPYFVHAQFSAPETIFALPDPGNRFPLVKAMWHYARGVAYTSAGNSGGARKEAARLAAIGQDADFSMLLAWGVPAPDMVRIARHVVSARVAQAAGDFESAIREFSVAVSIQDTMGYMEPPWWYYPVRQSLGAALLSAGKPSDAIRVLNESLDRHPNNVHALYVLKRAQDAVGDNGNAERTAMRLRQASITDRGLLKLDRL